MTSVIELADARTWPRPLRQLARSRAAAGDDAVWEPDDDFIAATSGVVLRTYHCTRLTPREEESVRVAGLRTLSPELVADRIDGAVADGHLTPDEGRRFGITRLASSYNRRGYVWLVGCRSDLADIPAVGYLLSVWGGEGIYMNWHSRSAETKRLEQIGTPSVVVTLLDPSNDPYRAYPGLLAAAVAAYSTRSRGVDICALAPIPVDRIESIEHPGSAFWNRYIGWHPG